MCWQTLVTYTGRGELTSEYSVTWVRVRVKVRVGVRVKVNSEPLCLDDF